MQQPFGVKVENHKSRVMKIRQAAIAYFFTIGCGTVLNEIFFLVDGEVANSRSNIYSTAVLVLIVYFVQNFSSEKQHTHRHDSNGNTQ